VRRAVQRFGGDAIARRPLLAERKGLRAGLTALDTTERKRFRALRAPGWPRRGPSSPMRSQTFAKAFAEVRTSVQFTELKASRSRRTIAQPAIAVTALRTHRIGQREALAAGGRWQDRGLVFSSAIGTPMEPRNVTRQFKALLMAASLPNIRSTICAIRALRSGSRRASIRASSRKRWVTRRCR
jgi:hypothetical protein